MTHHTINNTTPAMYGTGGDPIDDDLAQIKRQAAEIDRLRAEVERLRAERDHAKASYDATVRVLVGIHAILYPRPITMPDGRTMVFRPENAHEFMQTLSDRIRAIPDELAVIAAPASAK